MNYNCVYVAVALLGVACGGEDPPGDDGASGIAGSMFTPKGGGSGVGGTEQASGAPSGGSQSMAGRATGGADSGGVPSEAGAGGTSEGGAPVGTGGTPEGGAPEAGDGGMGGMPNGCSLDDRDGSYLATIATISGDCGEQTAAIIRLNPADPLGACMLTTEDAVSNNGCTLERSAVCPFPDLCEGCSLRSVGITTQQDPAGDLITGTMTITALAADNTAVCFGTYSIRAERQ